MHPSGISCIQYMESSTDTAGWKEEDAVCGASTMHALHPVWKCLHASCIHFASPVSLVILLYPLCIPFASSASQGAKWHSFCIPLASTASTVLRLPASLIYGCIRISSTMHLINACIPCIPTSSSIHPQCIHVGCTTNILNLFPALVWSTLSPLPLPIVRLFNPVFILMAHLYRILPNFGSGLWGPPVILRGGGGRLGLDIYIFLNFLSVIKLA